MRLANTASSRMLVVPDFGSWIVTMWHIGFDSVERYTGEKFQVSWEDFTGELIRVYSKTLAAGKPDASRKKKARNKCIIRIERQEYPKKALRTAVEQKLSMLGDAS